MKKLKLSPLPKLTEPRWLKGERGPKGLKGDTGLIGPAGIDGLTGPMGPKGLTGAEGPEGRRGARGLQGVPGIRGKDGRHGTVGAHGPAGKDGVIGPRGLIGKQGTQGRDGLQGPKGDKGDTPKHRWIGSKLQFELPSGKWGKLVDLRGPVGLTGGLSGWTQIITQDTGADVVKYAKQLDRISDTVFYFGEADPGTSLASGVWRIQLVTTQADGDLSVQWADGTAGFTKIWNDRAGYTYS